MKKLTKELRSHWPSHLITAFITLVAGALVVWAITSNVIVSGHEYRVLHVLQDAQLGVQEIFSEPIEVGKTGGFFSLSFIVHSTEASIPLSITYQTSFDRVSWHENVDTGKSLVDKDIKANQWYVKSLHVEPSAYLRVGVSRKAPKPGARESIAMDMFHHM